MRTIKFRVWDKGDKKIYYPARIFPDGFTLGFPSETKAGILMQFTGLKDRNGKEIYEGDILRIGGSSRVVEWKEVCDDKLCYVGFPFYYLDTERMSVIGNIYENPELLK